MIDLDDREAGFYWISVGGQAAEVALWHLEWTSWLVVGQDQPLTDDATIDVQVLSGCLVPPPNFDEMAPGSPSNDP